MYVCTLISQLVIFLYIIITFDDKSLDLARVLLQLIWFLYISYFILFIYTTFL